MSRKNCLKPIGPNNKVPNSSKAITKEGSKSASITGKDFGLQRGINCDISGLATLAFDCEVHHSSKSYNHICL